MKNRINRERLKAFIIRRRANFIGLVIITLLSVLSTLLLYAVHSSKADVLALVSVLLILLCFVQTYKMKSSYRTIPSFRGFRKRKKDRTPES